MQTDLYDQTILRIVSAPFISLDRARQPCVSDRIFAPLDPQDLKTMHIGMGVYVKSRQL